MHLINWRKRGIELRMLKLGMYETIECSQIFYCSSSWNVGILSTCAFISCLEIIALGYRWRVVLIVVDNACWFGKLKLINWICHRVWRLIEYINFMYLWIVHVTNVFICIMCRRLIEYINFMYWLIAYVILCLYALLVYGRIWGMYSTV